MPNVAPPNEDDLVEESNLSSAPPPQTDPRSADPASRAAGDEVQVRDTVRVDRRASVRTIESIHSDGSRSVVTATTDAATGNVTVEAIKYPAPTAFAAVDGGVIGPSEQNERSKETKRGTTSSSEASGGGAATTTATPGPEEVPASDRLPVLGKVDRADHPDDEADRKIKMDSGVPEQVPATDRLPGAFGATSSGATQDRKVPEKSKSPEKAEKRTTAAVGPEEVPPTEPRGWHHCYRDVTSCVRWRGLARRWQRRKNGGATEEALPSLDAVVPGSSSFQNDMVEAPDADPHDVEFGRDDHRRMTSLPRHTREGPDVDEGEVISEDAVVDIETGAGQRQSAGSTIEAPPPDEPTPLEAFAVVEREQQEAETQAQPSDPNERRAHEESLVRRHLLEEAVEGYVVPSGTTTSDRKKTPLEYLKRHPKMACTPLLAVLALILGATMLAVYVPRSSDGASKAIEGSTNARLDGNSSSPNATRPNPDNNKTKPPTVDPVAARYDRVKAVLGSVSESEALSDELSPQGRALSWIARTDPLWLPHDTEEDIRRLVQRYVLATMYFATGGGDGHWLKDYHFLEGIHECHWWNIAKPNFLNLREEGAFCFGGVNNGIVTHLHMVSNNISGTLPDEMRYLSDLHYLIIMKNLLGGTIPNWLGNLTNLGFIGLTSNEFTGTIPESLENLKRLQGITLFLNSLSGTIPDYFANMPLRYMLMYDNTLTGTLPESFRFLSNLTILELSGNSLNGTIPASWGEMSSLQTLSLGWNELTGHVPETLGDLGNLELLFLFGNRLNGPLPSSLGGLKSLTKVWMNSNTLTGTLPESFRFLSNLKSFSVWENSLNGTVPASWGEISLLETLNLEWNELTGHVPETLGNLGNLEQLYLNGNRLVGTLPSSLGGLKSLTVLYLDNNKLTGPIPDRIGNLTKLTSLDLSRNKLSGTIPESVSLLHHVKKMHISENNLSGKIPNIGNLTSLVELDLDKNQLVGPVPQGLQRLTRLNKLGLSENMLSGLLHEGLGNMTSLTYLLLYSNKLTGQLPTSLIELTKLEKLDLFSNNITGSIPKDIDGMKSLRMLALDDNALDGKIPESLGRLTHLVSIYLDNNNLSGSIPSTLGDMSLLRVLSLASNALEGNIPESFEQLISLEELRLEDNNLSGLFPQTLGSLVLLNFLDVHDNNVSGTMNILCENSDSVVMIADCSGTSPEILCDCCLCYPGMRCLPPDVSSRNGGPCKDNELSFAHYLQTDNYPSETSWYLVDATTYSVIASAYNYDSTCSYIEEKCLPSDGCYEYGIFDSLGDGICCDYGHGQYNITFGGMQVASGGQFGSYDIHSFGFCTAA